MKLFCTTFLILITGVFPLSAQTNSSSLKGFWTGAIEKDGKMWRVNLNVKDEKSFVDFIDVDAVNLEFSVKRTGEFFRLERPQPNGTAIIFEGKIEGENFRGDWAGVNSKAVFNLKRANKPPEFYREQEIAFINGDITLSGSLLLPEKKGKYPVVVITHGSGPATRASYKSWGLKFVKKGIAALIYDKRGNGSSTGEWRRASMEDLAQDAVAGVEYLKKRAEIDAKKIGVIGHSQGGWIAPLTATKSKDVSFVIASAASGISPDKQSIYHRANVMREMGFSEDAVKIATELRIKLYATGKMLLEKNPSAETERKKVSAELAKYAKEPWFERGAELPPNLDDDKPSRGALELLFFDPVPMWQKVNVPVLLIWGDKDTVVPVLEGKTIIETALEKAGNKNVSVKIFPNVDHGAAVVRQTDEWDFPRVELKYYDTMVEWVTEQIKT